MTATDNTASSRPDRGDVLRLLALDGQLVTVQQQWLTEDVDGDPLGVEVTEPTTATVAVCLAALGWTEEELRRTKDGTP